MMFFGKHSLAGLAVAALAMSQAWGAVTLSDVHVTNVGTTTFTVVWRTSEESTPGLDVFSDAAGTTALAPALEFYPLSIGDAALGGSSADRAARRALELLATSRDVVAVRVSGLTPATTYYVRPRTFDASGVDNGAAVEPLVAAITATSTGLVTDARLLRIRIPTFVAKGMILLVQGPAGTTPLSEIVGDMTDADVAVFPTSSIIDTTTGSTALFTSPQQFVVRAIGAGAPSSTFTQTVNFGTDFIAASVHKFDANLESPAPLITHQPANATVVAGAAASFAVTATGTPTPGYAWQRKAAGDTAWVALADNATYSGTATATLSIGAATVAMSGDQFRVLVSNGVLPDALSDAATLTVTGAPVAPAITQQPAAASVLVGANASFAVVATGVPTPSFLWQRMAAGDTAWSDLTDGGAYSGTTTATLGLTGATLAMNGDQFRVVVSNGTSPNATSNAVTLTVAASAVAPTFTTQPTAAQAGVGGTATFTVAASGTPTPAYHWQIRLAGTSEWLAVTDSANYSGAATATLTVKNATLPMSGDAFRAIAANGTSPDATSDAALLTVLPPPTITTQPHATSVPVGANATFTVAATGTGSIGYRWQIRAAGSANWVDLTDAGAYADTATATLRVVGVLMTMNQDQFRCVATDSVGSTASDAATLTVTKPAAMLTLGKLRQVYNGAPRPVSVTTSPGGLTVQVTYEGSTTAPTLPGTYTVVADVMDTSYAGTATGELTIAAGAMVRHAPTIAGGIDGSVHVMMPEAMNVTGWLSGDLLVPGTPSMVVVGTPAVGGTQDGPGSPDPSTYSVTFQATSAARYLYRRIDAMVLPTVAAPPAPTGTRLVTLTTAAQSPGDFATIRNLTVSGTAGMVSVPPGTYGNLTANGSAALVLGVVGATEPAVYNVQNLSINPLLATAKLIVVGPVVINVATTVAIYGDTGASVHPEWLTINVAAGNVSLNSRASVWGYLVAPANSITLNGTSTLTGGLIADRLTVTTNAVVKEVVP